MREWQQTQRFSHGRGRIVFPARVRGDFVIFHKGRECGTMTPAKNYRKTLVACYLGFITQAISSNYAPLLFLTFYHLYGISLSQLALIPTCFYITQLVMDFACVKIVDRIGYRRCAILSEITSALGLAGLAFLPDLLPSPFAGILLSTIVYAIGSGLIEVLGSPIVEACPFENKKSMMSLLHSFYCWGAVGVVLGSTLFFAVFGIAHWRILTCLWALIPLCNIYHFATCPIEPLAQEGQGMSVRQLFQTSVFWLLLVLMICAGSCEAVIAQWSSAFAESALHVSKTIGDLAGPCGFAVFMGISRVLFGRFGEKVDLTAFMIASGALCVVCYLLVGLASVPLLGLTGCMLCGFAVGIMWPGSISISSSILPSGGTAMFAFLALAGDLGASVGPALVGLVSQTASDNLQIGILSGIGFPLILVVSAVFVQKRKNSAGLRPGAAQTAAQHRH